MTESNFGDFELERKFCVRKLPEVTALDPRPELIVQAYLFAADGHAVRVRLQSSAPAELGGSGGRLIEPIGVPFSTSTVDSDRCLHVAFAKICSSRVARRNCRFPIRVSFHGTLTCADAWQNSDNA
jgi:hypothetical protein